MKDQIAVFKAHKIDDVKVKEQPYERELELTLEEVNFIIVIYCLKTSDTA